MSEIKPKRAAREPVRQRSQSAEEAIAAATASVIERNMYAGTGTGIHDQPLRRRRPSGRRAPFPAAPERPPQAGPGNRRKWRPRLPGRRSPKHSAALARGFEKAAVEVTGISRSGMAATADAAVALLGARTFAEALEINAGLARRRVRYDVRSLGEALGDRRQRPSPMHTGRFSRDLAGNWSTLGSELIRRGDRVPAASGRLADSLCAAAKVLRLLACRSDHPSRHAPGDCRDLPDAAAARRPAGAGARADACRIDPPGSPASGRGADRDDPAGLRPGHADRHFRPARRRQIDLYRALRA